MNRLLEFFRTQASDSLYLFWMKEILVAVLIFTAFYLLAGLSRYILSVWGKRLSAATSTDLDDRILERATPSISLFVTMAGLYYAVRSLPLPEKVLTVASGAVFVVNVVIIVTLAYRMVGEVLKWYAHRVEERHGDGFNRQLIPIVEKLISIFLIGTALIIILKRFNYDVLSLVTALGIGSLAIGMAAKDTLANMISGFTLMIDRPFRIGDRIQLVSGQWGDVTDIGLRTTKIKTVDNTLLIIPNSELCNTTIINMAYPDLRSKGKIDIGVAYGSDVEMVRRTLVEAALSIPEVLRDPAPEAFFISFGDSALKMTLIFWMSDYSKSFDITDRINVLITRSFTENGIEIPYPTRTVLLEKEPYGQTN